jgi:hypothetical protein
MVFNATFNNISVISWLSFMGGGNLSTRRKPVHKPPMHIRFDEISNVNFARSAGSTRSFDFDVETKSGTVYNFVGIEK